MKTKLHQVLKDVFFSLERDGIRNMNLYMDMRNEGNGG